MTLQIGDRFAQNTVGAMTLQAPPAGHGSQELHHMDQPPWPACIGAEPPQEAIGQLRLIDRRHATVSLQTPEWGGYELFLPPLMPTLQRPNIKPQLPMKLSCSPLVGAIHQGRDQHDEHFGIDLPSQEAHRYRGMPEATAFDRAAEAITPVPLFRELVRNSTCFAWIIGPVELTSAGSAAALGGLLGRPAGMQKEAGRTASSGVA